MTMTAKQVIEILRKFHPGAIVSILDGDGMEQNNLEFIEFCPVSNTISLQIEKPELVDTDFLDIEIIQQGDRFAVTKYYDIEGVAH